MVRLVCIALLVLGSRDAMAKRVMMRPSIASSCPGADTWEKTHTCVARFGKIKEIRSRSNMHLIRVAEGEGQWGISGLYLYAEKKGRWHLEGQLLGEGQNVVDVTTVKLHDHPVWRIDLRFSITDEISLDGETSRPAKIRSTEVAFCGGAWAQCTVAITSCDTFVAGKLLWNFRGKLEIGGDGLVHVRGDRSHAGARCLQDEAMSVPVMDEDFD